MKYQWFRVTKKRRCEICEKPDYCTYCPELKMVLCMRIESDRPSKNQLGGWLHKTEDDWTPPPPRREVYRKPLNTMGMWAKWERDTDHFHLDGFAMSLGVTTESLRSIGTAWADRAWGFQMKDENEKVIGIRLRSETGQKWAVKGSRSGLFIPTGNADQTMMIMEGPTDTAAALSLGVFAIGRPSCQGCEEMTNAFVWNKRIKRVIICADNDGPGMRGAVKLQSTLTVSNCLFVPPAKDLRAFIGLGGDADTLQSMLRDLVWKTPDKR